MEREKNRNKSEKGLQPQGWSPLGPHLFLELSKKFPILDVRSPKEYLQGHIPGASSLPLFTDEERAVVGTTYTRAGKEAAIRRGLTIVGPELELFVQKALEIAPGKEVLIHCWRGGMRSEAMAWLLQFAGIKTTILPGGYKAYRHFIRQSFLQGPEVRILGGMTGSGKTELLHELSSLGEQVIDLEKLACHKGSAFGALGQPDQPTHEQFENNLAEKWLALDPGRPVWIEDESRNVGKVIIPDALFAKMSNAPMVFIEVPFSERVERLAAEYGCFETSALVQIFEKISRRIGGDIALSAIKSLNNGNVQAAIAAALKFYDKTYEYGISKRNQETIRKVSISEFIQEIKNPSSSSIVGTFPCHR